MAAMQGIDRIRKLIIPVGIGIGCLVFLRSISSEAAFTYYKLTGQTTCTWKRVFTAGRDFRLWNQMRSEIRGSVWPDGTDSKLGIDHFRTPSRGFWIKSKNGQDMLANLLAEHRWMAELNPSEGVRPGDIVIDCGAHVGVFTHTALARGASQVVAVEPEPSNLECLRRNFAAEIATGRVIVVGVGVWDSPGTLRLNIAEDNSGMNSMAFAVGKTSVEVPVTTIDALVARLGLSRVDFIKMDIEGAERPALRGAAQTLKRSKPRLMLDTYHLEDDQVVLPKLINASNKSYQETCGPCEVSDKTRLLVPHVTYFF